MINCPRVHWSSCVENERRESNTLGLRFNQYSNSYRGRSRFGDKGEVKVR